jgi:hypothetical protein
LMSVDCRGSPTRVTFHRRVGSSEFFNVIRSPTLTFGSTQHVRIRFSDRKSTCTNVVMAVKLAP